ncbi:MAG TPA: phosphotransferase, partial [Burkholderiales bacterium]|nr:phosphotransferase [Burkholderiales bacterium]
MENWLKKLFPEESFVLRPASSDASFRRYFRASFPDRTLIVMDAPPPHEDCRPFVRIAEIFGEAGVHLPEILSQDIERGFLLLSDLGNTTYLEVLDEKNADRLYGDAAESLIKIQLKSRPGILPEYDDALLMREM